MRWLVLPRLLSIFIAALFTLAAGPLTAARAQEMHEFFSGTGRSPDTVDYGAAYYEEQEEDQATNSAQPIAAPQSPAVIGQSSPSAGGVRRNFSGAASGRSFTITSWLGRRPNGLTFLGVQLDRRYTAGAMISAVEAGSPAAQAGLRVSDVVVAVNGQRINTLEDLPRQIARLQPGERVRLTISRPE